MTLPGTRCHVDQRRCVAPRSNVTNDKVLDQIEATGEPIDSEIMGLPRVIVGGGSRDRKFYVAPTALAALPAAEVVTDLAKRAEP